MNKIKALLIKYKEPILYLFFGGVTTLVNIVVYWVCRNLFKMPIIPADIIAWILSVLVAFFTNKKWVFESQDTSFKVMIREAVSFFAARLFSLGVDIVFLKITVDHFHLPDLAMKIAANVVVIILNYVFSKFLIFRKPKEETSK